MSVCAIEHMLNKKEESDSIERVIPIAGDLKDKGGGNLDAKWELLSTSTSHSDSELEGLRVELKGGFSGSGKDRRSQKAIVEFICDESRTGLENLWDPEDKYTDITERDEEGGEPKEDDANAPSLQFVRYDVGSGDADVLRLKWQTKYACENSKAEQDAAGTHWGFFTWFIIMCVIFIIIYHHSFDLILFLPLLPSDSPLLLLLTSPLHTAHFYPLLHTSSSDPGSTTTAMARAGGIFSRMGTPLGMCRIC